MLVDLLFSSYIITSALILLLIHYLYKKIFALNYWESREVPSVKPALPLLGNFYELFLGKTNLDIINSIHDKLADHPFGGVYAFTTPLLILKDPDLIRRVLVKDFHCFVDRGFHSNPETDPIARNLIHMTSKDWKAFRPRLASVYTASKVKTTIESIMNICDDVVAKVKEEEAEQKATVSGGVGSTTSTVVVEVLDLMYRYSIDCYTTNFLGFNERSVINGTKSEFYRYGSKCLGLRFMRHVFVGTFYPRLHRLLKMTVENKDVTRYFQTLADRCLRSRKCESSKSDEQTGYTVNNNNTDLLQTLIAMKQDSERSSQNGTDRTGNTAAVVDDKFIAAQMFVFFIGSSDSVGNTLAFCLYELALQPKLQSKVRAEVGQVLDAAREVTLHTLNGLKYTGQVLSEAMRKYPPLSLVFRQSTQDYRIPDTDVVLEKGTLVFAPVHSIHRDPTHYPDPEAFDPERFSEENVKKRSEGAYLPFGRGPRMCPGTIVAMAEMKLLLAKILMQYEITLNSKTSSPLSFNPARFILAPKNGIWLNFHKLNDVSS